MSLRQPSHSSLPSHVRPSSGLANSQTSALQTRIAEKKLELDSLRQLRDLSGGLAGQMQQLEDKLRTLSDGTEAVAAVLGNWNQVLRAIYMASAKLPKPKEEAEEGPDDTKLERLPLPQTLVRIPIQQPADATEPKPTEAAERTAGE